MEMNKMRKVLITTAAALLLGSGAAFAQNTQPAQQSAKPAKDPNEVICEKQEAIGSRLATERVCKTRAEWAEERRLNRMDIDKAQTQRGTTDPH
jgi:invasion protein IalB